MPEEGWTMGLCFSGLSRERRVSVNGPVALMMPCRRSDLIQNGGPKAQYLGSNIPFVACEIVLEARSVQPARLVLEKFRNLAVVCDNSTVLDGSHY